MVETTETWGTKIDNVLNEVTAIKTWVNNIGNKLPTGSFPSVPKIEDIRCQLDASLTKLLEEIPEQISKSAGIELVEIAKDLTASSIHLKEPIAHLLSTLQWLTKQIEEANGNATSFKKDLKKFFDDLLEISKDLERFGTTVNIPLMLKEDAIGTIIDNLPPLGLFLIAESLKVLPNWENVPSEISSGIGKIPSPADIQQSSHTFAAGEETDPKTEQVVYMEIYSLRKLLKVIKLLIQNIKDSLPRDLSVTAGAGGMGAGTELVAHPTQFPFTAILFWLDLIDEVIFQTYFDLRNLYGPK